MPITHQMSVAGTEHTAETKLWIQLRGLLVLQNEQPIQFKLKLKQPFDVCAVNCEIQMSLYPQAATSRVRDIIIRHTERTRENSFDAASWLSRYWIRQSITSSSFLYFCIVFSSKIAQSRLGIFIVEHRNL